MRTWREARFKFERSYLTIILRRSEGNVAAAARAAGVDRTSMYRILKDHGLGNMSFETNHAAQAPGADGSAPAPGAAVDEGRSPPGAAVDSKAT
jgi:two-component system response regulator GlrR